MENFKGTKGKWQEHKNAFCCVISDTGILVANCGGRTSNINSDDLINEQKANALLISKAPEILGLLDWILENVEMNNSSATEMIQNLIKEATEINKL